MKDILIFARTLDAHARLLKTLEERTLAEYYGARLGAGLGASVSGIHVLPSPTYIATAFAPEVTAALLESARERERRALHAKSSFLEWVTSMDATPGEWLVAEGEPAAVLAQATTRYDLLVLDHAEDSKAASVWDLPNLILKAGAPCMVVPHLGVHYESIERIAVGWNGSPEAMRAVHAALPLMRGKQVLLLSGEEHDTYRDVIWKTPFNLAVWLERHGVAVEHRAMTARHDDAGGALLEEATKFRAQLLVMGAYGRNRFSEWMLGGATRDVLTWAELPVLLRH